MKYTTINPDEVDQTFRDCLFRDHEVTDHKTPANAVVVDGVLGRFVFNPDRLESHREQVKRWLELLPHEFRKSGGGGWSFLNACNLADGTQWTGLHERMNQLFSLAIGLKLAKWSLPREMWGVMPGGMPYVEIEF